MMRLHLGGVKRGVYPADLLPSKIYERPCALIVNTDPSTKPGQHWIAIFISASGKEEFFDSYGRRPKNPYFLKFLKRNADIITFNNKRLQSYFSDICGQYSLLYLYFRISGYSVRDFVSLFGQDCFENDQLARKMYRKIFRPVNPVLSRDAIGFFIRANEQTCRSCLESR